MVAELFAFWVDDIGRPGVTWTLDIMWAIANLSEEHARRITEYLGWTREELESEYRRIYLEGGR